MCKITEMPTLMEFLAVVRTMANVINTVLNVWRTYRHMTPIRNTGHYGGSETQQNMEGITVICEETMGYY